MHDDINLKACPQICLILSNKEAWGNTRCLSCWYCFGSIWVHVVYDEYMCVNTCTWVCACVPVRVRAFFLILCWIMGSVSSKRQWQCRLRVHTEAADCNHLHTRFTELHECESWLVPCPHLPDSPYCICLPLFFSRRKAQRHRLTVNLSATVVTVSITLWCLGFTLLIHVA